MGEIGRQIAMASSVEEYFEVAHSPTAYAYLGAAFTLVCVCMNVDARVVPEIGDCRPMRQPADNHATFGRQTLRSQAVANGGGMTSKLMRINICSADYHGSGSVMSILGIGRRNRRCRPRRQMRHHGDRRFGISGRQLDVLAYVYVKRNVVCLLLKYCRALCLFLHEHKRRKS